MRVSEPKGGNTRNLRAQHTPEAKDSKGPTMKRLAIVAGTVIATLKTALVPISAERWEGRVVGRWQ